MEKVNKLTNLVNIVGDCDAEVDWEDFVLIQGISFYSLNIHFRR